MAPKQDRNRWAPPADRKRFTARSRCQASWGEFSAQLFRHLDRRRPTPGINRRWATGSPASLPVTITCGTYIHWELGVTAPPTTAWTGSNPHGQRQESAVSAQRIKVHCSAGWSSVPAPKRSWLVRRDDPAVLSRARACQVPTVADERGGAGAAPGRGRIDVFSRDCGYLFGVVRVGVPSTADLRLIVLLLCAVRTVTVSRVGKAADGCGC